MGALVILLCGGSFSLFCHAVAHMVNIRLFWLLEVVHWSKVVFMLCKYTIIVQHNDFHFVCTDNFEPPY